MSKVRVHFSIVNEEDTKTFTAMGIYKENTLLFYDDQHVKHTITLGDDKVRYKRTGSLFMDFLFEKGHIHPGKYRMNEGGFLFMIHTHEMNVDSNEFSVRYSLKQEDMLVNQGYLSVTFEEI
ncbi:MAG: DUF1934 domain-containing protein [Bacillota bacterium]